MLCVWWDRCGIIHFKLLNRNEMVIADLYLYRYSYSFLEKHTTLINQKNVVLLHDNARPQTATQSNTGKNFGAWLVCSTSPILTDYHLFISAKLCNGDKFL